MRYFIFCIVFVTTLLCNTNSITNESEAYKSNLHIPVITYIEEKSSYIFYDIPLNNELQIFIQDECSKYGLSFELVLAIIATESKFKTSLISKTNDYGLMQVNYDTFQWINQQFNNKLNIMNVKDNIIAGVWYLNYLKEYWMNFNLCDEDVFDLTVISYNRGEKGASDWVKKYGYNNNYLKEVIKNKTKIEKGEYNN